MIRDRPPRDDELESIFADCASARHCLIAVSGGPDSMALMVLAARWAKLGGQVAGRPTLSVASIDHGLRPAARAEAALAAEGARRLGLPHRTLQWAGEKPVARVQERARAARYALLDACADDLGADLLMTAHHADDQAETILFRLTRGSGLVGLAGMAPITRRGAIIHARPLLGLSKAALAACCEREGVAFICDPSNEDVRFARARLRRLAPILVKEGFGREACLRLGRRAARADAALHEMTQAARATMRAKSDAAVFHADLSAPTPLECLVRILYCEVERVSGRARPRFDRCEALASRLADAARKSAELRATLGGALVRIDRAGVLTITPESVRAGEIAARASLGKAP